MKNWRRLALTCAAALAIFGPASAVAAKTAATTTTTAKSNVVRSPLDEPIGSGTVVNAWAVAPVGPSVDPKQPSERPFLSYTVVPGQVIHDAVTLFNYSNVPLTFRLLAADAFDNASGAFDVPPSGTKPKDVGTWVKLDQETLALPAKSQATVPLTLTVPRSVSPGDHAGAIIASSAAIGTGPDGRAVNIDRRTGTRLYIRVAGPLNAELSIAKMSSSYHPSLNPFSGKVNVTYRVENDGNVRLGGKQTVSAQTLFGLVRHSSKQTEVPELLPGQGFTVKQTFHGMPALLLTFAKAHLMPNKSGAKTVSAVSRSSGALAIPWSIVALVFIAYFARRAWRAYRSHQTA